MSLSPLSPLVLSPVKYLCVWPLKSVGRLPLPMNSYRQGAGEEWHVLLYVSALHYRHGKTGGAALALRVQHKLLLASACSFMPQAEIRSI